MTVVKISKFDPKSSYFNRVVRYGRARFESYRRNFYQGGKAGFHPNLSSSDVHLATCVGRKVAGIVTSDSGQNQ